MLYKVGIDDKLGCSLGKDVGTILSVVPACKKVSRYFLQEDHAAEHNF